MLQRHVRAEAPPEAFLGVPHYRGEKDRGEEMIICEIVSIVCLCVALYRYAWEQDKVIEIIELDKQIFSIWKKSQEESASDIERIRYLKRQIANRDGQITKLKKRIG